MAKHWLTGADDGEESTLSNILSNEGALKPILGDPASRAALLQIGLNLMQPFVELHEWAHWTVNWLWRRDDFAAR